MVAYYAKLNRWRIVIFYKITAFTVEAPVFDAKIFEFTKASESLTVIKCAQYRLGTQVTYLKIRSLL